MAANQIRWFVTCVFGKSIIFKKFCKVIRTLHKNTAHGGVNFSIYNTMSAIRRHEY
jgi:hypothetical protein